MTVCGEREPQHPLPPTGNELVWRWNNSRASPHSGLVTGWEEVR